jgi:uncharacterized membrane protein
MFPWTKYLSVALASTLKFVGGPITGFAFGLSWLETAAATLAGMMLSVTVAVFVGEALKNFISKFRKTKPKLFSRTNRLAVRTYKRFGIHGIALLTPILFTPIGGTLIAVSFKIPRIKTIFWMFIYGTFWAVLQSYVLYLLKA